MVYVWPQDLDFHTMLEKLRECLYRQILLFAPDMKKPPELGGFFYRSITF